MKGKGRKEGGNWSTSHATIRESGIKEEKAAMPDWCVQRRLIEGEGDGSKMRSGEGGSVSLGA